MCNCPQSYFSSLFLPALVVALIHTLKCLFDFAVSISNCLFHFTANFLLLLTKCLLGSMENSSGQENGTTDASDSETTEKSNSSSFNEEEEPSNLDDRGNHIEIDFTDKRLLVTMLEVLVITWISIKRKLDKVNFY